MSQLDASRGAMVLGASTGNQGELQLVQAQLGARAADLGGEQAWVSVIGEGESLLRAKEPALRLLESKRIEVLYHGVAELCATFVVAVHEERRAVQALYHELLGG